MLNKIIKICNNFNEEYYKTIRSSYLKTDGDIYVNPTEKEARDIFNNSELGIRRGIRYIIDNNKLYMWDAGKLLHDDVFLKLNLDKNRVDEFGEYNKLEQVISLLGYFKNAFLSLVQEDAETDKHYREVSNDIYKYIYDNFYKLHWIVSYTKFSEFDKAIGGIKCTMTFKDLPTFTLKLLCGEKEGVGGSFSAKTSSIYILTGLPELEIEDITPENRIDELSPFFYKFQDLKNTFTHEFVHFLDFSRSGIPDKRYKTADTSTYYKSPREFNAYFQEFVNGFEDYLKNKSIFEQVSTFSDFNEFLKEPSLYWKVNKIYLEDTNLGRRFKKRLYQYFVDKKKEVYSSANKYSFIRLINEELEDLKSKRGLLNNYISSSKDIYSFMSSLGSYPNLYSIYQWLLIKDVRQEYLKYKDALQYGYERIKEFYETESKETVTNVK